MHTHDILKLRLEEITAARHWPLRSLFVCGHCRTANLSIHRSIRRRAINGRVIPLSRFLAIIGTLVTHYDLNWHSRWSGASMALSTFEHMGDVGVSLDFPY